MGRMGCSVTLSSYTCVTEGRGGGEERGEGVKKGRRGERRRGQKREEGHIFPKIVLLHFWGKYDHIYIFPIGPSQDAACYIHVHGWESVMGKPGRQSLCHSIYYTAGHSAAL